MPGSLRSPFPIISPFPRRPASLSGGGLPKVSTVVIPSTLEEARRFFARLPPAPPGRTFSVQMSQLQKKSRRCHGCHGWSNEQHASFPLGANRCTLEHDDRCTGGIVSGRDRKGSEWTACPPEFLGTAASADPENSESESVDLTSLSGDENEEYQPALASMESLRISTSAPACHVSGNNTTTVSSAEQPRVFTSENDTHLAEAAAPDRATLQNLAAMEELALMQERQQLVRLQQEREALVEAARLQQQQKFSAERVELQRQLQAEQELICKLKKTNSQALPKPMSSSQQLLNQPDTYRPVTEFTSFYNGPDIRKIRKVKGLGQSVESQVEKHRENIPSLSHRQDP